MKIYEYKAGMYSFKYLPGFAKYVLENYLEHFVATQLELSQQYDLPLLKHLKSVPRDQLMLVGKQSVEKFLTYLAENKATEQISDSIQRWKADNLEVIGKFNISAEDITGLNHIRSKTLKQFLREYRASPEEKLAIVDEIDEFIFGSVTTATNNYIDLLKEKLSEEAHFNDRLITSSPGIIFIFDLQSGKEVFINGNVEIMGYAPSEIIGMEENIVAKLTHPDDIPILIQHLQDLRSDRDEKTFTSEYRFLHKDGQYRWLRTYDLVFRRDEMGQPLQVLGTTFEITKEREIAVALQQRESQLLEAQSITHVGSFEWDLIRDKSVNTPELYTILELDQELANSSDFIKYVHPEDAAEVEACMRQSMETGTYDCQYRYRIHNKEKYLWARGVVAFKDGRPVTMRGTVQDITELKRIEDELIRKTLELERSNESLQQFASIASHDLKEPLRKMSMYSDMVLTVEEGKLSQGSQVNLERVKSSSIRLKNMIEDILNFSTITNKETQSETQLEEVVNEARVILEETISEKNATITTDGLPVARVIPSQFRQLFQNLFNNALKFSKPDVRPEIKITHQLVRENAAVDLVIHVQDNGIGFKADDAERIFGLFTRLHGRGAYEGTGLGLAICKRIVENHGGSISASSEPGLGARFTIRIPMKQ